MPKAIRIQKNGGPEVLTWEDVTLGSPGPGEVRVRHEAVGLNYIDTYHRGGLYPVPLPTGLGSEAAGVIEAVGPQLSAQLSEFKPGDRVAYAGGPLGAYCEARNMPAAVLVKLPEDIPFEQGAAMMLQGMTVQYLIKRCFKVQPGDFVLFHAAAGGVGTIACQWLSAIGAVVIGTAGSEEKCALARAHGAKYCINYRTENFLERVKEITAGALLPVVYDSVGKDTFQSSLDCLRPFGLMVSFGNSSGPVPPFDLRMLKGSLFITRPSLQPYTAKRTDLLATAADLFEMVRSGKVKIEVNQRYPLRDAAQAHRDLEARKTTGSTILVS